MIHIRISTAMTTILGLCACFTAMMVTAADSESINELKSEDVIYAAGQAHDSKDLILLGKEYTYQITENSKDFFLLMKLDAVKLDVRTKMDLIVDGDTFKTTLGVFYYYDDKLTSEEEKTLLKLKIKPWKAKDNAGKDKVTIVLMAEGKIFAKKDFPEGYTVLSQGRDVRLVTKESNTSYSSSDSVDKSLLPFPFGFDVITSPQHLFFLIAAKRN